MRIGKRHALIWGPFFIFLVAFVLHVNQMYVMFAALGLLAPVSYALGRRKLAGIDVSRHGKSVMIAGERGTVTLTVRNDGDLRQTFVLVRDRLPDGLESPEGGEVMAADLPPGGEVPLQYGLLARRRGAYQVGPPTLVTSDYLGLAQFRRRIGDTAELLVYPRAIPIPDLWPKSLRGRAPHKSRLRMLGQSSEFFGLRDYAPGDDMRRVAWKTSAKRGKLSVVESEHTETTDAVVVLDLSARWHAGEGDGASIEYGAVLAASLAEEALQRGANVGLVADGAEDRSVLISSDPRQQIVLLEALARVEPDCESGLMPVLARHQRALTPGCVIAVVSPATDEDAVQVAGRLRALEHPVVWCSLAPHTFSGGEPDDEPGYEAFVGRLTAQGARVIRIYGTTPLETNLWRRGRRVRRG